jgi:hypothetical protein
MQRRGRVKVADNTSAVPPATQGGYIRVVEGITRASSARVPIKAPPSRSSCTGLLARGHVDLYEWVDLIQWTELTTFFNEPSAARSRTRAPPGTVVAAGESQSKCEARAENDQGPGDLSPSP